MRKYFLLLLVLLFVPVVSAVTVTDVWDDGNLTAYYKFNEGSGSVLTDFAGNPNNHNGTIGASIVFVDGLYSGDYGLKFPGSSTVVTLANRGDFGGGKYHEVDFVFNYTGLTANSQEIILTYDAGDFKIAFESDTREFSYIVDGGNCMYLSGWYEYIVNASELYNVSFVMNGTHSYLIINGLKMATDTSCTVNVPAITDIANIGRDNVQPLNGTIYAMTIYYNATLSDSARTDVFNAFYNSTVGGGDSTAPTWVQTPSGFSYINNTVVGYQTNATDDVAVDVYYANDSVSFSFNSSGYLTNLSTLSVGNRTVALFVNDTSGNVLNTNITVETLPYVAPSYVDGRLSCEVDGTCCYPLTYEVGELCWINISWSDCVDGLYCPEAHYNYDEDGVTFSELHQMHNFGADWHMSNPDDMQNPKGGIFDRPSFRSYGNVQDGLIIGGGENWDFYCNSWKCMANSDGSTPGYKAETEGITWNTSYFGWTALECSDGDNCDASATGNTDGLYETWRDLPTSNIAVVDEAGYSCSDCFIIEYNDTLSASSYEPSRNVTFVLAVHPKPINWTGVNSSSVVTLYYNASNNEVLNITYGVFRKPYADDLADYVGNVTNYLSKEAVIRNWTRDFYRGFYYPEGQTDENKTDYYNGLLSYAYNTMGCWLFNDTTSNFYVDGHCGVINTPNKQSYHGMWSWDSSNTGAGILSSINFSSDLGLQVLNITVGDWLRIYTKNMTHYPVVDKWYTGLNEFKRDEGATQHFASWGLVALNFYNRTDLFNESYFCGEVVPTLRSQYSAWNDTDVDDDGLIGASSGAVGRDGTDVMYVDRENTDATLWNALTSKSLENIYVLCGNTTESVSMSSDFNRTMNSFEKFWNSSCNGGKGCYWNFGDDADVFYDFNASSDNDWATTPFANAMASVLFNLSSSRVDYLFNDLLMNNFTDSSYEFPFTSIPRGHPSFVADGGSGLTWDGALWTGVDGFWSYMSAVRLINVGNTDLSNFTGWYGGRVFDLFGLNGTSGCQTPYGAESYNGVNGCVTDNGLWASNPYGWGGNIPTAPLNSFDIFSVLGSLDSPPFSNSAPVSVINYPVDLGVYNQTSILVNLTGSDADNVSLTGKLFVNGSLNVSNSSLVNGSVWSLNASWGVGSYSLLFESCDLDGLCTNSSGVTFDLQTSSVDWENRFNLVNNNFNSGMGVLHFDLVSMLYNEEPNVIHSYLNMYESTGNVSYLEKADVHLLNMTSRYEATDFSSAWFTIGHLMESSMRFVYLANHSGNASMGARGSYYLDLVLNNMSVDIDSNYTEFTYGGETVGVLRDNVLSNAVRPINQQTGYMVAQAYLYNVTGNQTYYDRALRMSRGMLATFSYDNCSYNASLICHSNPYRFNYSQSWENYENVSTFGFSPYDNQLNYGSQEAEALYRMWKYGFVTNETVMERMANTIYYNMYVQEGGLSNVLFSRDWGVAGTSYSDFHVFGETHYVGSLTSFKHWNSDIGDVTDVVRNYVYDVVESGGVYSWYVEPYSNILDPRTSTNSTYLTSYDNVTGDLMMVLISSSLYNSSVREYFNGTESSVVLNYSPTGLGVLSPVASTYGGGVNVSWSEPVVVSGGVLSVYNVSLWDSGGGFLGVLRDDVFPGLSFVWESVGNEWGDGSYYVVVNACDSYGYCANGSSPVFVVSNTVYGGGSGGGGGSVPVVNTTCPVGQVWNGSVCKSEVLPDVVNKSFFDSVVDWVSDIFNNTNDNSSVVPGDDVGEVGVVSPVIVVVGVLVVLFVLIGVVVYVNRGGNG